MENIKALIEERKNERFWKNLDIWLVAVILDENNEQVYGRVKNGLAILNRIPNPETGYSYHDIVRVVGPVGKQMFRDEEIEEYKAIGIYKKSNIPTFSFKAIIPKSSDYFKLLEWFKKYNKKGEFPWSAEDNNLEWRNGYCIADSLEQATKILSDFIELDNSRKVKDIYSCNYEK